MLHFEINLLKTGQNVRGGAIMDWETLAGLPTTRLSLWVWTSGSGQALVLRVRAPQTFSFLKLGSGLSHLGVLICLMSECGSSTEAKKPFCILSLRAFK